MRSCQTDAQGGFEFKTVPSGDYHFGVRLVGAEINETVPYPRTYYPGVGLKSQAHIVSVEEGQTVSGIELRLPQRLDWYNVEGLVVWSDGRPAPDVSIYLSLQEEGETSSFQTSLADKQGHFTIKVYAGLKYKVSAYPLNTTGDAAQSAWVEVPHSPGASSIKLVLPVLKK
jgi:hypothetical protein